MAKENKYKVGYYHKVYDKGIRVPSGPTISAFSYEDALEKSSLGKNWRDKNARYPVLDIENGLIRIFKHREVVSVNVSTKIEEVTNEA